MLNKELSQPLAAQTGEGWSSNQIPGVSTQYLNTTGDNFHVAGGVSSKNSSQTNFNTNFNIEVNTQSHH